MIKLIDILNEVILLEYNKSQLDYITVKLNVKDKNEFNSLMNALDTQGIKYPDLKKQIEAGSLKTIEDLKKLKTMSKTDTEKQIKSDVVKILDNSDFLIIQPKTYEANCYYGAGTKWCTTDKEEGPERFEQYTEYNPITFIIDKSKSQSDSLYKVAISYETYYTTNNGERLNKHELTVWNAEDELISYKKYFNYLKSKGVDIRKILKL
jgi:hypothetical protein